jgi:3-methyladenine DNA glycosylase AlkD
MELVKMIVQKIVDEIESRGDAARAETAKMFLQIRRGGYGFGDRVCGVSVPELRKIAAKYSDIATTDIEKLLQHSLHEARFAALVLMNGKFPANAEEIFGIYIKNTRFINNWDLVDVSAHKICGAYCLQKGDTSAIWQLANSANLWENRMAMVSTMSFIWAGKIQLTIDLCEHFIGHGHHIMHKACGWMLRELGKKDRDLLINFVASHKLPSITKSYALEIVKKNGKTPG